MTKALGVIFKYSIFLPVANLEQYEEKAEMGYSKATAQNE